MSTHINQYVIYGIRLTLDDLQKRLRDVHGNDSAENVEEEYHDNGYSKEIGGKDGFAIICAAMSGDYAYFGCIMQKPPIDEWLESVEIKKAPRKLAMETKQRALQVLGADLPECGWHIVSHWH